MATKLNKTEKTAQRFCEWIKRAESAGIIIEWRKSKTWGSNPVILYADEKCCNVSGCGYCKESTALADTLRFLFEPGTPEYSAVWTTGGCGVSSVINTLAKFGWELRKTASSSSSDAFEIRKIAS